MGPNKLKGIIAECSGVIDNVMTKHKSHQNSQSVLDISTQVVD